MKKILLVILLLVCIVGCNKKTTYEKQFEFSLMSNESTGYSWDYTLSKNEIVKIYKTYDDSGCGDRDGCTGHDIYTVKALEPGTVKLSMKYCSVSNDNLCEYDVYYEIIVDKQLNITEKHYGSYYK